MFRFPMKNKLKLVLTTRARASPNSTAGITPQLGQTENTLSMMGSSNGLLGLCHMVSSMPSLLGTAMAL